MRLSLAKIKTESSIFLERIQGDICGPIRALWIFRYFMILVDASSK